MRATGKRRSHRQLILTLLLAGTLAAPIWLQGQMGAAAAAAQEMVDVDAPPALIYTALGDSIATGLWSASGYVPLYAEHLRADVGAPVQLNNLAVNGWSTADLLRALQTNEAYRVAVQNADVVTIGIGGNDLLQARRRYLQGACGGPDNHDCLANATQQMQSNWDVILDEVTALVGSRSAVIRTMDVYNPYVAADAAHLGVFQPYLEVINANFCMAAEQRGMTCARVFEAFNGSSGGEDPALQALITFDGIHPSARGHALIAELLRDLGYAPLR